MNVHGRLLALVKQEDLDKNGISIASRKDTTWYYYQLAPDEAMDVWGNRETEDLKLTKNDVPSWFEKNWHEALERFKQDYEVTSEMKHPGISKIFVKVISTDRYRYPHVSTLDEAVQTDIIRALSQATGTIRKDRPRPSKIVPEGGKSDFTCAITRPALEWFQNLAEINEMDAHAFYWQKDGLVLKGTDMRNKFAFDVFLKGSDTSIFKTFSAGGKKPAFFKDLVIDKKAKFIELSVTEGKSIGVEVIEQRLQELADLVDAAFTEPIIGEKREFKIKGEVMRDEILPNFVKSAAENVIFQVKEGKLFLTSDDREVKKIPIALEKQYAGKEMKRHAISIHQFLNVFQDNPLLDMGFVKIIFNGIFYVETSNTHGSKARFMIGMMS
jgi:hypothetical protein